jgi:hypothetical protein
LNEHHGHLRLRIDGLDASLHRTPEELAAATGREPEVRLRERTSDERAAGVRPYEITVEGWVFEVAVEDEPR